MDRGENERVWDRKKKNWEGNMEKETMRKEKKNAERN